MDVTRDAAKSFQARLWGGPEDGDVLIVPALPDGEPPEFLHADDDESGMYLLAGLPGTDGSMPFWWVPAGTVATRNGPAEATWTLISLADDGATKLWHQHGEDSEPVRLVMEPLDTSDDAPHTGTAFNCPDCEDAAVLSRPLQGPEADAAPRLDSLSRRLN